LCNNPAKKSSDKKNAAMKLQVPLFFYVILAQRLNPPGSCWNGHYDQCIPLLTEMALEQFSVLLD
jgi:hypothetical protein